MSAWTWTFVKATSIPKDIVNNICDNSIKNETNIWYYKKWQTNPQTALKEWFKMHDEERDYFIEELGVSPDKLTHESLENELKKYIKDIKEYSDDLSLVKEGKLTLDECLRKHKIWEDKGLGHPLCYNIDDDVWVNLPYEIFRLREYSDMTVSNGLKTIDDLIKYLSEPNRQHNLIWWENNNMKEGMFPEFEARLKEYYGQFGDGNFSVHFG